MGTDHDGAARPRASAGDATPGRGEASRLLPLVYDELRSMGRALMSGESPAHTLQPTILVHEVYLKLADQQDASFADEAHFKAVAATAMRRVLIDHARRRGTKKRGGGRPITLDDTDRTPTEPLNLDALLALDDALNDLRHLNPRQASVVEMRYFGGMTFEQAASALDISMNTAKNDWRFARAWLQKRIDSAPSDQ